MNLKRIFSILYTLCFSIILLSACSHDTPAVPGTSTAILTTGTAEITPRPTPTPVPPTPTPIPMAAIVNGEAITLDEFMAELTRFQAANPVTGTNLASEPKVIVLNELIGETLLAQSAEKNGFTVDEAMLQTRIDALTSELTGIQALDEWKAAYGYSDESFEKAFKRSIEAAWMRDKVISTVPETADQVHVRQILLTSKDKAEEAYKSLQTGTDFLDLVVEYNPTTGGDLGWFPRGYLMYPAIEEAAFSLQPGQYSDIVETEIGYHILYLVERDNNHVLLPDAKLALQVNAIQDWIAEQRSLGEIQILLP